MQAGAYSVVLLTPSDAREADPRYCNMAVLSTVQRDDHSAALTASKSQASQPRVDDMLRASLRWKISFVWKSCVGAGQTVTVADRAVVPMVGCLIRMSKVSLAACSQIR